MTQAVLTIPRAVTKKLGTFTSWEDAEGWLESLPNLARWTQREEAEHSKDLVQPIPSAVVSDGKGRFLVLQRVSSGRKDMNRKLSVVVGGHIDVPAEQVASFNYDRLFQAVLRRELNEELGVSAPNSVSGLGVVIDTSNVRASRHIAIVYLVLVAPGLEIKAEDEFSTESALTKAFLPLSEVQRLQSILDPWSNILWRHLLRDWVHRRQGNVPLY